MWHKNSPHEIAKVNDKNLIKNVFMLLDDNLRLRNNNQLS